MHFSAAAPTRSLCRVPLPRQRVRPDAFDALRTRPGGAASRLTHCCLEQMQHGQRVAEGADIAAPQSMSHDYGPALVGHHLNADTRPGRLD